MAEWKETDSSSLAALTRDTSTLADAAESMQSLVETIWRLRQPDGCPWDREQTHESIAKNMIEEAYEAVDCIEQNDEVHLREELGDVLMQVVLHAQIAADAGAFTMTDVARDINRKLIRRHPHVFGDDTGAAKDAREVLEIWDSVKLSEKSDKDSAAVAPRPDAARFARWGAEGSSRPDGGAKGLAQGGCRRVRMGDRRGRGQRSPRSAPSSRPRTRAAKRAPWSSGTCSSPSSTSPAKRASTRRVRCARAPRSFVRVGNPWRARRIAKEMPIEGLTTDELNELWDHSKRGCIGRSSTSIQSGGRQA